MYIYGEDTLRSREYLNESKAQFKKQRDPAGYNTIILDGKKMPASRLIAEVGTAPFLGEKRMVIVENILSSSDKEALAEIKNRILENKISETTILVFWQGEAVGKTKEAKELQEILQKQKYAKNHEKLIGLKLVEWIEAKAKALNAKIEKNAALKLAEEGDSWSISSKLNQLSAFASGRAITLEDVEKFAEQKLDDNVFNLTDAVVSGNHKKALALISDQRELGEDDIKILGLILWQFRIILEMSDLVEREGQLPSDAIAKKIGIHPFVAKKNLPLVKQYSLARLEAIYGELLQTDRKIKTGRGGQSLLLDLFVSRI